MRFLLAIVLTVMSGATALHAEDRRPSPTDIKEFVADPIPALGSDYFKDFKVTQKYFNSILKGYFEVEEQYWKNGYSHVAFGNRTGHVTLKDGSKIKWMVKPGGLAWLEFPDGKRMFLAAEKTKWPLNR